MELPGIRLCNLHFSLFLHRGINSLFCVSVDHSYLYSARSALAQLSAKGKASGAKKPAGARAFEAEDNEDDGLSEQEDDDYDDDAEDVVSNRKLL